MSIKFKLILLFVSLTSGCSTMQNENDRKPQQVTVNTAAISQCTEFQLKAAFKLYSFSLNQKCFPTENLLALSVISDDGTAIDSINIGGEMTFNEFPEYSIQSLNTAWKTRVDKGFSAMDNFIMRKKVRPLLLKAFMSTDQSVKTTLVMQAKKIWLEQYTSKN